MRRAWLALAAPLLVGAAGLGARPSLRASRARGMSHVQANSRAGRARGVSQTQVSARARQGRTRPRVHFLFLMVDHLQRADIWNRFFAGVPHELYRVFWHCKDVEKCRTHLAAQGSGGDNFVRPHIIDPPMPTQYCTDLVSAENRLLETALATSGWSAIQRRSRGKLGSLLARGNGQRADSEDARSLDKFIFVSDSTLPVKPFMEIYATLTAKRDSRFCIFPQQEWATAPRQMCEDRHNRCDEWANRGECAKNPLYMHFQCERSCQVCTELALVTDNYPSSSVIVAAKTHEWKILNRVDAERSVKAWHRGYLRHLGQSLHLNWHDSYQNAGCLDEFWHFATLYGAFPEDCLGQSGRYSSSKCAIPAANLHGGEPIHIDFESDDLQGTCDTFVMWRISGAMGTNNAMARLDERLTSSGAVRVDPKNNPARPETIVHIATSGLAALRDSNFLFARKFLPTFTITDDCRPTADIWAEVMFKQNIPDYRAQNWIGEGVWVDSKQHQVSIISDSRSASRRVVIQNGHEPEWSGVGSVCGEQIWVRFANKMSVTGNIYAADGNTLHFSNGIKWHRDVSWLGDGEWRDTYRNPVQIRSYGGGMLIKLTSVNYAWHGTGQAENVEDSRFKMTFNNNVVLYGKLSHDMDRIQWHNGETWTRDQAHRPPCVCQPSSASWRKLKRTVTEPKQCFFMNVGAGSAAAYDVASMLARRVELGGFEPQQCRTYVFEANPRFDGALRQFEAQLPQLVTAMPSTAAYSCVPPGGGKAELGHDLVQQPGGGGQSVGIVNILRFIYEAAAPGDHVILKLDLGGAEWDILPCLARSPAARLVDVIYIRDQKLSRSLGSFGTIISELQPTLDRLQQFGVRVIRY